MTRKLVQDELFVTTLGIALRIYRLAYTDLWYDESFTAWMATLPLANMLRATAGDVHPPLWYLIEMIIVRLLGTSEAILRLPSVILGCINLWLFHQTSQTLGLSRRVRLSALLLLAVSPMQIYYSQEARMYQLLQFGTLLALWTVLKFYRLPRKRWAIFTVIFTVAGLLILYTHNLGFLYLVALNLTALVTLYGQKHVTLFQRLMRLIWNNVTIAAGFLPWAWVLIGQMADVGNGFWIQHVNFGEALYNLYMLYWFHSLPPWATAHAAAIIIGLTLFALWWAGYQIWHGQDRQMLTILLVMFITPQALAFAISKVWQPIYLHRGLIGVSPVLCWLIAYALDSSEKRRLGAALVGIPLLCLALGSYYFNPNIQRDPVSEWAQIIKQQAQPGDVVFHANLASYIMFHYYLDMDNVVWRQANDLSQSLTDETKEAMLMDQVTVDELTARARRVWLIYAANPATSTHEDQVMQLLLRTYPNQKIATFKSNKMVEAAVWLLDLEGGGL